MKAWRQSPGRAARVYLLLLSAILMIPTVYAQPVSLERMVTDKAREFFEGSLSPAGFSVASPWRRNFEPANLANRAALVLDSVSILEVRLPIGARGLEGIYSIRVRLETPAFVGNERVEPGTYWLSGNITFVRTTRGWLVDDLSFVVLDEAGRAKGANFLPWKTGLRIGSR